MLDHLWNNADTDITFKKFHATIGPIVKRGRFNIKPLFAIDPDINIHEDFVTETETNTPVNVSVNYDITNFVNASTDIFYEGKTGSAKIKLLGGIHVSSESALNIYYETHDTKPDCMFLELCSERLSWISNNPFGDGYSPVEDTLTQVFAKTALEFQEEQTKKNQRDWVVLQLINPANWLCLVLEPLLLVANCFSNAQQQVLLNEFNEHSEDLEKRAELTSLLGGENGVDMRTAFVEARKQRNPKCSVVLGDRRMSQTEIRKTNLKSVNDRIHELSVSFKYFVESLNYDSDDYVGELIDQFSSKGVLTKAGPENRIRDDVILDERNEYMVGVLQRISADYDNIVAIVGAAHVPGMVDYFNKKEYITDEKMQDLCEIPNEYWMNLKHTYLAYFVVGIMSVTPYGQMKWRPLADAAKKIFNKPRFTGNKLVTSSGPIRTKSRMYQQSMKKFRSNKTHGYARTKSRFYQGMMDEKITIVKYLDAKTDVFIPFLYSYGIVGRVFIGIVLMEILFSVVGESWVFLQSDKKQLKIYEKVREMQDTKSDLQTELRTFHPYLD